MVQDRAIFTMADH